MTTEIPTDNVEHLIQEYPIEGEGLISLECSCDWDYDAHVEFAEAIKLRHLQVYANIT